MSEWHVTPEYILEHWTEAKLLLMFTKRNERLRAINDALRDPEERPAPKRVSADQLFSEFGSGIKKVN